MTHQIILDPSLGLSAGQFAAAWNARPACRELAIAQTTAAGAKSYDPAWAEMVNLIVAPLAMGVAGNALYDLMKDILRGAGVRRLTRIEHHQQTEGSGLTIITVADVA